MSTQRASQSERQRARARMSVTGEKYTSALAAIRDFDAVFSTPAMTTPSTPLIVSTSTMSENPLVRVIEFVFSHDITDEEMVHGVRDALRHLPFQYLSVVPQGNRRATVYVSEVFPIVDSGIDWDALDSTSVDIPFGTGVDGAPVTFDPSRGSLLVTGNAGSGKSVFARTCVYGALRRGYEVTVVSVAATGEEFRFAEGHLEEGSALQYGNYQAAAESLRHVQEEMLRRSKLLREHKVSTIDKLPDGVRPPRHLVVVDEYAPLILPDHVPQVRLSENSDMVKEIIDVNDAKVSIAEAVSNILWSGRATGISAVLITHKVHAETVRLSGGALKENTTHLVLGRMSYGERLAMFSRPELAPELREQPRGSAVYETPDGTEPLRVWFASPEDFEKRLER